MVDAETTEVAIRRSFILEKKESRRRTPAELGFSQINYGSLFVRDKWTLFAIARELNCSVEDILEPKESSRHGPKMRELISASEVILDTVRSLPHTLRDLVAARGSGHSWRRIQRDRPGRLMFSIRDDYGEGVSRVLARSYDSIYLIANFFVVSRV